MQSGSDIYEDVTEVYIRLVEHHCPDAAAAIRQIHATVGTHAALRAALVISLLHMEVQENQYLPDLSIYTYLFEDFPEAVGLLEQAVANCLQTWGISQLKVQLHNGNPPQRRF